MLRLFHYNPGAQCCAWQLQKNPRHTSISSTLLEPHCRIEHKFLKNSRVPANDNYLCVDHKRISTQNHSPRFFSIRYLVQRGRVILRLDNLSKAKPRRGNVVRHLLRALIEQDHRKIY